MEIRVVDRLEELPAAEWDRLAGPDHNPFLSHAFLAGLERHGCVGAKWGWEPQHLTLRDKGRLVGAVPLYLKHNSYGELVFDGAWADAYRRCGGRYYPKLVSAIPYSPVGGPRMLVAPVCAAGEGGVPGDARWMAAVSDQLTEAALGHARTLGVSSLHWLFPTEPQARALTGEGRPFLPRNDCQFHWYNRGYRDFDDFLDGLTAQRRKQIRRERRKAVEAGVELKILQGREVTDSQWAHFYRFYASTFDRRGGYPTLTRGFFQEIGARLGDQVVLILAYQAGLAIAGALFLRSTDTLYGRHWGCDRELDGLHFEACCYQGIDYCIRHGLTRFEPGAQGEHKVWRGFEPTPTWSAHWLADPAFHRIVARHLQQERVGVAGYIEEMKGHLPFRSPE